MSDFLIELFGELLEIPFDFVMRSKKVKTWIKTVMVSVPSAALISIFAYLACSLGSEGSVIGAVILGSITFVMLVAAVYFIVRGHRQNWAKY